MKSNFNDDGEAPVVTARAAEIALDGLHKVWGQAEWLQKVQALETQRDALVADSAEQGAEPLDNPDLHFVLGKLSVAHHQLELHVADETFKGI